MEIGIFLLLGSNLGDRQSYLKRARQEIAYTIGQLQRSSSIYKTASWGIPDQPEFLNQVIRVKTSLNPDDLLSRIQAIEDSIGRIRKTKWGSRVIDIDILFYDQQIITQDHLTIPHPGIPYRRFTLEPLAEIAPDFIHPLLNKDIQSLLQECEDTSPTEKTSL